MPTHILPSSFMLGSACFCTTNAERSKNHILKNEWFLNATNFFAWGDPTSLFHETLPIPMPNAYHFMPSSAVSTALPDEQLQFPWISSMRTYRIQTWLQFGSPSAEKSPSYLLVVHLGQYSLPWLQESCELLHIWFRSGRYSCSIWS